MEQPNKPRSARSEAALRRLQETLRKEMRTRSLECRYAARCPVQRAGNCPGVC
jgi:hypothetical protein